MWFNRLVDIRVNKKHICFCLNCMKIRLLKLINYCCILFNDPMKRSVFVLLQILFVFSNFCYSKNVDLRSPDGKTKVEIKYDSGISYKIYHLDKLVLDQSKIALRLQDGRVLGNNPQILSINKEIVHESIDAPLYKFSSFEVNYRKVITRLKSGFKLEFRVYDNGGVAYRFIVNQSDNNILTNEQVQFNFNQNYKVYAAHTTGKKDPLAMAFQNTYSVTELSKVDSSLIFLPMTVDLKDGLKLTITESDLENYPGMFLNLDQSKSGFNGVFAGYPLGVDYYSWRSQEYVTKRASYIAKLNGNQKLPWRIISISEKDTEMPVNNLVYALASPNRIGDCSWIKPGKCAWEWWNDWGVYNVDFQAGINMATYKYYIDFASKYGLEYVILDEGWYNGKKGDMFDVVPQIDIKELVDYARKRNVGIVLWTVFNVLDKQLEDSCKYYSKLGVKGFKVDFLDRDDQEAIKMVYQIAETAAKYKLVLDLHGFYKPTGINRTYPNIINFEGVFGMEEMKWSTPKVNMPQYDVTFPFIRMMAGPVDYTPGAMRNATKSDFKPIYSNPLSQGTRCHQLATYVVYDSPFTMLCDAPVYYEKEEDYTKFLSEIPLVADETKILKGIVGEYIVTARRYGTDWYIGGLTNWDDRDLSFELSFLSETGIYCATIYEDGINANKQAADYKVRKLTVNNKSVLNIKCASGGGFVVKLKHLEITGKKELYLPKEIYLVPEDNDFSNNESEYSFKRSLQSENLALFWSKEYGENPMVNSDSTKAFNPQRVIEECERFYNYYVNELEIVQKGCSLTDKYKLLIFVFGGNEGTAFGGGAADKVGVLWTPAVRINREPYGALAHEMAHSFQYLSNADYGTGPTGPIIEMSAQYMLWQVYPEWMTFEKYHLDAFLKGTHFAFLHPNNMYHSPFVIEYWSQKHGKEFFGRLCKETQCGEDPVSTYKRINALTQEEFNDEMFDAYRRFVTWDLERVEQVASKYTNLHQTKLVNEGNGWYRVDSVNCPQNYGYNAIQLKVPDAGSVVELNFKGITGSPGYSNVKTEYAGWRYGFVASLKSGERVYSDMFKDNEGQASFIVPPNTEYLWFVVSGAPTKHWPVEFNWESTVNDNPDEQWPYKIRLKGTEFNK